MLLRTSAALLVLWRLTFAVGRSLNRLIGTLSSQLVYCRGRPSAQNHNFGSDTCAQGLVH